MSGRSSRVLHTTDLSRASQCIARLYRIQDGCLPHYTLPQCTVDSSMYAVLLVHQRFHSIGGVLYDSLLT
eukprot:scaffold1741_cov30-Tisochrysis_lutea.AAC.1